MDLDLLSVTVPAKVIYAGEHAVVRGGRAIVAPHFGASLTLTYCRSGNQEDSSPLLRENIDELLKRIERPRLPGTFQIQSSIPQAGGLGSSAALSVALARLLDQIEGTTSDDSTLLRLSREFENHFHGTSSGLDPAGVLSPVPVLYQKDQGVIESLKLPRHLEVRLVDSGRRAKTIDVNVRVKQRFQNDPSGLKDVDQKMDEAVDLLVRALKGSDQDSSTQLWVESFELAHGCFVDYGLVDLDLVEQKNKILKEGALSAKLTGKGLGGYWLALFSKTT